MKGGGRQKNMYSVALKMQTRWTTWLRLRIWTLRGEERGRLPQCKQEVVIFIYFGIHRNAKLEGQLLNSKCLHKHMKETGSLYHDHRTEKFL
jgi:hypothetical protein